MIRNFTFVFLFSLMAMAAKELSSSPIGHGGILHLTGVIVLPAGQKLNPAAPSKISVMEKIENTWTLTEKVNLNDFFSVSQEIPFQRPVHLRKSDSEVRLEISLYHCPRLGKGICVIDDFSKILVRNLKQQSTELNLRLVGSQPR